MRKLLKYSPPLFKYPIQILLLLVLFIPSLSFSSGNPDSVITAYDTTGIHWSEPIELFYTTTFEGGRTQQKISRLESGDIQFFCRTGLNHTFHRIGLFSSFDRYGNTITKRRRHYVANHYNKFGFYSPDSTSNMLVFGLGWWGINGYRLTEFGEVEPGHWPMLDGVGPQAFDSQSFDFIRTPEDLPLAFYGNRGYNADQPDSLGWFLINEDFTAILDEGNISNTGDLWRSDVIIGNDNTLLLTYGKGFNGGLHVKTFISILNWDMETVGEPFTATPENIYGDNVVADNGFVQISNGTIYLLFYRHEAVFGPGDIMLLALYPDLTFDELLIAEECPPAFDKANLVKDPLDRLHVIYCVDAGEDQSGIFHGIIRTGTIEWEQEPNQILANEEPDGPYPILSSVSYQDELRIALVYTLDSADDDSLRRYTNLMLYTTDPDSTLGQGLVGFHNNHNQTNITSTDTANKSISIQAYPNPFNPVTTIKVALPKAANMDIKVYNLLGQQVHKIAKEKLNAGYHSFHIDGSQWASGIYFLQTKAGEYHDTRKLVLVK